MLIPWLPAHAGGMSSLLVLIAALAIDAALGDPPAIYRAVPHPVAALGRVIAWLDARWNDPALIEPARRRRGALAVLLVVAGAAAIAWLLALFLRQFDWSWVAEALAASTLLAFRGLHDHVARVASALDEGIEAGRGAVAEIVGRDPASLDAPGIARAAIESTAENFADGAVAPVFWFLIAGLPGLAAYKAVNTLDSMIGHRTERHEAFGRAAARLDDALNLLPARIAGGLIVLAGAIVPGASAAAAWRAMVRDARRHRSPNAGWPEAAMAGALGLSLAGPRRYDGKIVEDAWMGDGRRDADPGDIRRALRLYLAAGGLMAAFVVAGLIF